MNAPARSYWELAGLVFDNQVPEQNRTVVKQEGLYRQVTGSTPVREVDGNELSLYLDLSEYVGDMGILTVQRRQPEKGEERNPVLYVRGGLMNTGLWVVTKGDRYVDGANVQLACTLDLEEPRTRLFFDLAMLAGYYIRTIEWVRTETWRR